MTILLLKGYNNYFNRIAKKENDLDSYKTAASSYLEFENVNFDPQDGIMTSLIVGGPTQDEGDQILWWEVNGSPDYLLAIDPGDDDPILRSRWFIVECVRVRAGQYKLALKRDVLVDFNEQIMNSPCFVEKGTLNNPDDVLVLNPEGMKFNQQKQNEEVLRDRTNCAWLVGYLKKDINTAQAVNYTFPAAATGAVDLSGFSWANCVNFQNLDGSSSNALKTAAILNADKSKCAFRVNYKDSKGWDYNLREEFTLAGNLLSNYSAGINSDWAGLDSVAAYMDHHGAGNGRLGYAIMERVGRELFDHTFHWGYVSDYFNVLVNNTKTNIVSGNNLNIVDEDLMKYNGILVTYDNKIYKLTVGQGSEKVYETYYTGEDNVANDYISMLYYEVDTHGNYKGTFTVQRNQSNPTKKKVRIDLNYRQYNITATEIIIGETISYTMPTSANRNGCNDAIFDIFAMPVSPAAFGLQSSAKTDTVVLAENNGDPEYMFVDVNSEYQLAMAATLATKFGAGSQAGYIYDLQLLPYCPFEFGNDEVYYNSQYYGPTYDKYVLDIRNLTSKDYTIIRNGNGDFCGIVFYPKKSNFSAYIDYNSEDTTVHYEWLAIDKPTLLSQGRQGSLTRWTIHEGFPYPVTDGTWEIGPNTNNQNVDVELSDGLTNEECAYINLSVSPAVAGGNRPFLSITSTELPLQPVGDYSTKITGDFTVKVRAHWVKPDSPEDVKVKNECDFYRLTSPNYNSFYEFKKTKLNEGIHGLRAVCTYKPYNPYIKINPNLDDSLYSIKDYNDNIGLELAGDYSIPMMSDAMVNYELNNRNYQAIFNRQVQNLDVSQRIAKEQQQFQGVINAITAPIGGAVTGGLAGAKAGPYGAIAGAVVGAVGGGVLGGVGYAKDMEWLQQQQYEARDYALDQFQYQLGNIEALPQTMTKSTPLSFNNKVWPILEYFSCTDREKEVLRDKIKWDGMTIMAVGRLIDYATAGGYLKGKMIRILDLCDDSHIAQAIYEEVNKGFYEGDE